MKIEARQVQQDIQTGKRLALIDVRTPVEHMQMHIAGSVLMPLDRLDPATVKAASAGTDGCVLICQSGKRAERAFHKLQAAGCKNLSILDGGVANWEFVGLPLERAAGKHLPLMRQVQLLIGVLALAGSILALAVDKNFAIIPALLGAGLTMAGATGWCGLAILLSKMPWNKSACCGK